jgi:hypothetical protein
MAELWNHQKVFITLEEMLFSLVFVYFKEHTLDASWTF